jgi:hypothetical protein
MYRSLRVLILGKSTEVKGKCKEIFEELVIFNVGISHLPFDVSNLKEFEKLSHLYYSPDNLENLSEASSLQIYGPRYFSFLGISRNLYH